MSDRLSQLQTCLDQLITQYFSSINHVNKHHDYVPTSNEPKVEDTVHEAAPAEKFQADLLELSKDIAAKAQQVELLIDSLPGLETSEETQMAKVLELEQELQQARVKQQKAVDERRKLAKRCDELILRVTEEKVALDQVL